MLFTSSDYDTLRLFSSGKLLLASVSEHLVLEAVKSGELISSVKLYVPEFGSIQETYGLAVPENAPARRNALLFMNFLTREESIEILIDMLSVRPVSHPSSGHVPPSPDAAAYKRILDSFKNKVLYY